MHFTIKHFKLNSHNSRFQYNFWSLFFSRLLATKTTEQIFFALCFQFFKSLIVFHCLFLIKCLVSCWKTIFCPSLLTSCMSPFPILPFLFKSCHFTFRRFKNNTLLVLFIIL